MSQRAVASIIVLAAIWGSSYLFIKVSLDDLSPGTIAWARIALGALVLVPYAVVTGALGPLRGHVGPAAVQGLLMNAIPFTCLAVAQQWIPSGLAGVLVAATPAFTAVVAVVLGLEGRFGGIRVFGLVLGLLGVGLLLGAEAPSGPQAILGGLLVLGTAASYACGANWFRLRLAGLPPTGVVAVSETAAAVLLLPLLLVSPPVAVPTPPTLAAMAVLGIVATGLAFVLFYRLIREVGPFRASLITYLAPVFAVFYGIALLAEPLTAATIVGGLLVLAGSWLAAGMSRGQPDPAGAKGSDGPASATMTRTIAGAEPAAAREP
jgi:drug/metabolite transporter (DMT)-like permease